MTLTTERSLKDLFQQPYRLDNFRAFLDQVFPQPDKYLSQPLLLDANERKARQVNQRGLVTLADGRNVAIFEVEVANTINIQRNRQGLREIAARYIDQSVTHAALVVYYSSNQSDYRLSLIAKTTEFTEEGELVVTQTAPKRFTYVLGPNEPCTTAARQFMTLLAKPNPLALPDMIEAFSVERLTKDFFKRYNEHYVRFWTFVAERDEYAQLLLDKDESKTLVQRQKPIRDFAKKLLGRLVFLQFLQKKGWMGVAANRNDWLGGDAKFVRNLFETAPDKNHFYSHRLTKLFFETLNTDHPQRPGFVFGVTGTKVPYLNGGLFDNDTPQTDTFDFPAEYFASLFDTFDQYNFTIDENSPDEQEVGIDPEMLGHIFENLLEENREKGTFYTPKAIVHYMAQESLIQYLRTHLPECNDEQAPAMLALEAFIRVSEIGDRNDRRNFIVQNAQRIESLLDTVKICDPAIGSGAFPMGLLQEIFRAKLALDLTLDRAEVKKHIIQNSIYGVDIEKGAVDIARLRFWLALVVDEDEPQPLPNLDYKIMQGNSLLESFEGIRLDQLMQEQQVLYVVDNGQMDMFGQIKAPQLGMHFSNKQKQKLQDLLRLYYDPEALRKKAVAKEAVKLQIEKIVHDHIEYNFELVERSLERQIGDLRKEIGSLEKAMLNNPNEPAAKRIKKANQLSRLGKNLANLETRLTIVRANLLKLYELDPTSKPYFLWHLFFKDVFDKGGFDILIGNPPYVQLQKMGKQSDELASAGYESFTRTGDIYCLFYELGINILREHGTLTYITSNKWMKASYGQSLRQYFITHCNPLKLIDFGGYQVFENATVDTNILIARKEPYKNRTLTCVLDNGLSSLSNMSDFFRQAAAPAAFGRPEVGWAVLSSAENRIKQKIEEAGRPLKEWDIQINYGIKTGFNEAFIIDSKTKDQLISECPESADIIHPILRGKDIKPYSVKFSNLWLINSHNGLKSSNLPAIDIKNNYTAIFNHLKKYEEQLINREDKGDSWLNLRNCAYFKEFEKPKIIYPEISKYLPFYYDEEGYYINNKTFFIAGEKLKYLTAVFNSNIFKSILNNYFPDLGGDRRELRKVFFNPLKILQPDAGTLNEIESIIDLILSKKKNGQNTTNLEKDIDQILYKAYNLNVSDVSYIERFKII